MALRLAQVGFGGRVLHDVVGKIVSLPSLDPPTTPLDRPLAATVEQRGERLAVNELTVQVCSRSFAAPTTATPINCRVRQFKVSSGSTGLIFKKARRATRSPRRCHDDCRGVSRPGKLARLVGAVVPTLCLGGALVDGNCGGSPMRLPRASLPRLASTGSPCILCWWCSCWMH